MMDIYYTLFGWAIRWAFHYGEEKNREHEKNKSNKNYDFPDKLYFRKNIFPAIASCLTSIALYYSLPSLFSSLNCEPCNNHFMYLLAGYCNREVIIQCIDFVKKKEKI